MFDHLNVGSRYRLSCILPPYLFLSGQSAFPLINFVSKTSHRIQRCSFCLRAILILCSNASSLCSISFSLVISSWNICWNYLFRQIDKAVNLFQAFGNFQDPHQWTSAISRENSFLWFMVLVAHVLRWYFLLSKYNIFSSKCIFSTFWVLSITYPYAPFISSSKQKACVVAWSDLLKICRCKQVYLNFQHETSSLNGICNNCFFTQYGVSVDSTVVKLISVSCFLHASNVCFSLHRLRSRPQKQVPKSQSCIAKSCGISKFQNKPTGNGYWCGRQKV